jgi:hypothetical protein
MRGCAFLQVPFWGPTEAAIFKQVQRGQLDLTRTPCKKLSRESKELMLSMLNRDPAVCPIVHSCLLCLLFLFSRIKLLVGMHLPTARLSTRPDACVPHSRKVIDDELMVCRRRGTAE